MEEKLIEQIIAESCNMHPLIQQCSADFPEKLKMQFLLEGYYDNDLVKFSPEFMLFLVETEEYETAVLVRDEFLKKM